MNFEVRIDGRASIVELNRDADRWQISIDGRAVDADAVEIAPGIFSILLNGKSYEVRVTPSPAGTLTCKPPTRNSSLRSLIREPGAAAATAHSKPKAASKSSRPCPEKLFACWFKTGEKVEAGQGLLVVEAMKMQNEIRSPKSGTVERLC